jgi:hypothetical protein
LLLIKPSLDALKQDVATHLLAHGLQQDQFFVWEIRAGDTIGSAGRVSSESIAPGQRADRPSSHQTSYLEFSSAHLELHEAGRCDVSIRGNFGLLPSLTVVNLHPDDVAQPSYTTTFETSLSGSVGGELAVRLGDRGELTASVAGGFQGLMSDATVVSVGGKDLAALTLAGIRGSGAGFGDGQLHLRFFDNALEIVHLGQSALSPAFHLWGGYRYDGAFNGRLPLPSPSAATAGATDAPPAPTLRLLPGRWIVGAQIALNKTGAQAVGDQPKPVAIIVAAEYQNKAGDIPGNFRLTIRADVDLLKTLLGSQDKAAQTASQR